LQYHISHELIYNIMELKISSFSVGFVTELYSDYEDL